MCKSITTFYAKKIQKQLTSVSFAFTHTYTLVKINMFVFFPKHTWKILKNAQKPFTLPYLISLKVPAFSQYSTCWDFYSIFVFVFKYLYTVLQGFWWRNPRARAFLLSWNQLILEEKRQRAPCDQDTTLYGSKPLLWKRIVYQTIVGRRAKLTFDHFRPTHTYIKLTLVSF